MRPDVEGGRTACTEHPQHAGRLAQRALGRAVAERVDGDLPAVDVDPGAFAQGNVEKGVRAVHLPGDADLVVHRAGAGWRPIAAAEAMEGACSALQEGKQEQAGNQ